MLIFVPRSLLLLSVWLSLAVRTLLDLFVLMMRALLPALLRGFCSVVGTFVAFGLFLVMV
jgi:hypothetical protein